MIHRLPKVIEAATRCYFGPFSSRSDSETELQTQTGGSKSTFVAARGAGDITLPGAVGGNVVDRSGQTGGFNLAKGAKLTINAPGIDQAVFTAALDRIGESASSGNAAFQEVFNESLSKLSELAEQKQNEGQPFALTNRTIIYLVVAVAAAVTLIFVFRRK
jgi:hypothetical protein